MCRRALRLAEARGSGVLFVGVLRRVPDRGGMPQKCRTGRTQISVVDEEAAPQRGGGRAVCGSQGGAGGQKATAGATAGSEVVKSWVRYGSGVR